MVGTPSHSYRGQFQFVAHKQHVFYKARFPFQFRVISRQLLMCYSRFDPEDII
jgi:hypothetical protein